MVGMVGGRSSRKGSKNNIHSEEIPLSFPSNLVGNKMLIIQ